LLERALRRARWELRTLAGRSPALCRVLVKRSGELPTEETEICIEGAPRSGNTFAVVAFRSAQPKPVSIAHHVHAPGSVIQAIRLRKPAVALIRDPEEAILSLVLREPWMSIRQAARSYIRFYGPLVRYAREFVAAPFTEVVSDFGAVIRRVNARWGTAFVEFDHSEENVRKALEEVDAWDRNAFGQAAGWELRGARPSQARDGAKEGLRAAYRAKVPPRLRRAAEDVYGRFVGHPGSAERAY